MCIIVYSPLNIPHFGINIHVISANSNCGPSYINCSQDKVKTLLLAHCGTQLVPYQMSESLAQVHNFL